MEVEKVKAYIKKKCLIVLKNNFQYTAIIPDFDGTSFSITDKFGDSVDIECEYIAFISSKNHTKEEEQQ